MQIAVVQHEIVWESPEANFAALTGRIDDAAATGARLISLTETFSWGFSMNTGHVHEPVGGPSTEFLQSEAARVGSWIVGSIPVKRDGADRPNNRMVMAGPDGELHTYDKIHPFTYSGEKDAYLAGDDRMTVTIDGLRISTFICFDLRFADEFWSMAHDTDCYLVIANWPASRREHWKTLLSARAIENQAWVVGANRVGSDPNVAYAGDSQIIDPFGAVIAELPDEPGIIHADVTPERVAEVRSNFPFLADRR